MSTPHYFGDTDATPNRAAGVGNPEAAAVAAAEPEPAQRAGIRRASTGRPSGPALNIPLPPPSRSASDQVAQSIRPSFATSNLSSGYSLRPRSKSAGGQQLQKDNTGRDHDSGSASALAVDSTHNNTQSNRRRSSVHQQAQANHHNEFAVSDSLHPPGPILRSHTTAAPPGHVAVFNHSPDGSMSRPRAGRGALGRDTRDGDLETDLLNRVIEAVKKAKEHNENCQRLGSQIIELETEIKAKGASTPDQHRKLDTLYREMMRNAEQEKRVDDDEDVVNNLAIIVSLKTADEPPPRPTNHPVTKRKPPRPATIHEPFETVDSPGPSPGDRVNDLKRNKPGQRSSSVASSTGRSSTVPKGDSTDVNRGIQAEKAGHLIVGAEVFYRFPKGSPDDLGIGIQCIIKKVWQDRKPIVYDVQDPDVDPSGKQNVHRAQAKDLIPIPPAGTSLQTFPVGAIVFARYPDTDTFYKAEVRGIQKGEYTLRFDGEEDDKEQPVEKRFVLDSKVR